MHDLTQHRKVSDLYILGDLFDVWIGDDHQSRYNQRIIDSLRTVSNSGIRTYLIVGNRDFLIGERFAKQANLSLLADETVIDAANTPILLCHGDQLCTDDVDYIAFRERARQPEWQRTTLAKPLWQRKLYGRYLRWQSQRSQRYKSDDIMDVNKAAVLETVNRHQTRWLVHGHTHRAAEHKADNHTRWVLDAWHKAANSLWLTHDQQQLHWDMRWKPFE